MKHSIVGGVASTFIVCMTIACRHQAVTSSLPVPTPRPTEAMQVDQVNTEGWNKAWTNLLNVTEQSFAPSLPKLLGVEVELIAGNPGQPEDELTLTIVDAQDQKLVSVTQTMKVDGSGRVMFFMPDFTMKCHDRIAGCVRGPKTSNEHVTRLRASFPRSNP